MLIYSAVLDIEVFIETLCGLLEMQLMAKL